MTINDLIATYTVDHQDKLYFRVEIFRTDTGAPIQNTSLFSEVYLLRFPNGSMATKKDRMDSSFRQSWVYLEDFPRVHAAAQDEIVRKVNEALARYGNDYLKKFDPSSARQK